MDVHQSTFESAEHKYCLMTLKTFVFSHLKRQNEDATRIRIPLKRNGQLTSYVGKLNVWSQRMLKDSYLSKIILTFGNVRESRNIPQKSLCRSRNARKRFIQSAFIRTFAETSGNYRVMYHYSDWVFGHAATIFSRVFGLSRNPRPFVILWITSFFCTEKLHWNKAFI